MSIEAWFPFLALTMSTLIWSGLAAGVSGLLALRTRETLAGVLIVVLIAAAVISYAYAALTPLSTYPFADYECLGPPYETC